MNKVVIISEKKVRLKMVNMGINSLRQLSHVLAEEYGMGKNTIYDAIGDGFSSKTVTALTNLFDCDPGEILERAEVSAKTQEQI